MGGVAYHPLVPDQEPSTIGHDLGTLFSDFVPFAPSGARRAGAASLMARRVGEEPSLALKYPMISQLLAGAVGGVAGGAALNSGSSGQVAGLAAIAPYVALQAYKRHLINSTDEAYQEHKHKRLREMGSMEDVMSGTAGSHRLGMAQAYEAMRTRKLKDVGSIAEAADALPVAATFMGLGPQASLPFTQLIDQVAASKMLKNADFVDQQNAPAIPLYLAAAAASGAGLDFVGRRLQDAMNNGQDLPRSEWDGLVNHVSGHPIVTARQNGLNNAGFTRPTDQDQVSAFASLAAMDPNNLGKINWLSNDPLGGLKKRVANEGIAVFGDNFGKPGVVGHEAGHGKIEHSKGILHELQSKMYPYAPVIAPLSAVGSMAAGLSSGSTLKGLLAGTGIGLLGGAGMMLPEAMATYHGLQGLKSYKGGKFTNKEDLKRQLMALSTYGAVTMLPSMLSGAFGGYVSGKRKKKREKEEAAQE